MDDAQTMALVWGAAAALFVLVELATVTFVAIYFAIGSAAAAVVALLGGGVGWQMAAFSATGIALLLLTRPFFKQKLESPDVPTNVNRLIGKGGIVTITIDNDANTGQIRVGTEYWTARMPADDAERVVPVDTRVVVEHVEGVTALVRPRAAAPSA
jgi:membrane protein implicated in regulation of membrane protease activity